MKLMKLLLLLTSLLFLNSCTYFVVKEIEQQYQMYLYPTPDFMNVKYDSNFVDIETIKARYDSTKQAIYAADILLVDTLTTTDKELTLLVDTLTTTDKEITLLVDTLTTADKELTLLVDTLTTDNEITTEKFPNTTPAAEQKEFNISTKITSINSNHYPDSIIINAIVNDNNGGFIAGLAPPYLSKTKNYKDYWKFIIDSCKGNATKIENFEVEEIREATSPIYSICYVLDHSPSMGNKRCLDLQQAVRYSMGKVKESDYLSAIKFSHKATVEVLPTNDKEEFKKQFKLNGMARVYGGGTDILLALDSAAEVLKRIPEEYQRIIILFTDGESWMADYNRVIGKIRQNNIKVFTICYGQTDMRIMDKMAKDTDGKMFLLRNVKDFAKAFQYIYNTLSNYYKITYKPPICNDLHNITLDLSLAEIGFASIRDYGEYDKSIFTDFVEVGTVTLMDIEFEYNKSTVSNSSIVMLEDIANQLKRNKDVKIEICGHTDDIGSDEYNLQLSNERAKSVRNELTKLGIDGNRLKIKGYGKTKPIAPNDSDENRKRNRRTEFIVIE